MKKLFAVVLVLCFLPVCSFALDLYDFNINAAVLGEEEIDDSSAIQMEKFVKYKAGDCYIGFYNDESRIIVQGNGVSFLAYAMAAIMSFDDNSESYSYDAGRLLIDFFLSRKGNDQYGYLPSGAFIMISKTDNYYLFMVKK